ncbi:MAG: Crp/Fnr family transcriptional regulator [Bacteroidales bacterium]|nr:Crp/Fnr family transcriptional regulator [Bacteroidales bacterium]
MDVHVHKDTECLNCALKEEVFKTLKCDEIEKFKDDIHTVSFKRNESIYRKGIPATHIGFVKKGLVKIISESFVGSFIVKIVPEGNFIGLPSVFGDKFFHTSAVALVDTEVCFINKNLFHELIKTNGNFASKVVEITCKSELQSVDRIAGLIRKQLPGRLADVLLFFSNSFFKNNTFELPMTRNELADFIGVSKKSFIRTMTEFKNDRLIDTEGRNIKILEVELLERLSKLG